MASNHNDVSHANCWAEIDLRALAHNVAALKSVGPDVMAVLKADAYGHGVDIIAPELLTLGISDFGVATAAEGAALRCMIGQEPNIFVMTASAPDDAPLIADHSLTPFISTRAALHHLSQAAIKAGNPSRVHIEIDTGIGRAGVPTDDFLSFLIDALLTDGIVVGGVCTHFTSGEDPDDVTGQYALFARCLESIPSDLSPNLRIHAANSPAVLNIDDSLFDMIRPGLLLYGIAPSAGSAPKLSNGMELVPVLSLKSRVILVRDLPAGTPISYGRTYILNRPATIATIGIGYGDGYSRQLSNIGSVMLPSGKSVPIRGRVCMDQICVEVPKGEFIREGDVVTLVDGAVGNSSLRAADIAGLIHAAPHEITTCITQRVRRVGVR